MTLSNLGSVVLLNFETNREGHQTMHKPLSKTQIAIINKTSLFHDHKVKAVSDGLGKTELVIKKSTNQKLGKTVTKGKFKGFPIFTVTLEERATCPTTCGHWKTCYGNNMPFATRYTADKNLTVQMALELVELQRKHPNGFLVRLHVLGDFFSVEYVKRWASWLKAFPALHVYGYSAYPTNHPIRNELDKIIGPRFAVRASGNFHRKFTALSMDDKRTAKKLEQKQAFVCPVQLDKTPDCGACGLCWTSAKPVVFITH